VPVDAVKLQVRSGGMMGVNGQLQALSFLPLRKNICYPLNRRIIGLYVWSGFGQEEK